MSVKIASRMCCGTNGQADWMDVIGVGTSSLESGTVTRGQDEPSKALQIHCPAEVCVSNRLCDNGL